MKRVRKIADKFAISMKIGKLPLEPEDLEEIAIANGWNIVPYSKGYEYIRAHNLEKYYYTSIGFIYVSSDGVIIFIKDELNYLEKIDVLCHEIGHLVLGHIAIGTKQKLLVPENTTSVQELEADVFALVLQAPTYLMQELRINSTRQLIEKGIFSKTNARKRYKYFIKDAHTVNILFKLLLCISTVIVVALSTFRVTKNYYTDKQNSLSLQITETTTLTESSAEMTSSAVEIVANNKTVYVTKSGTKYHTQNCYHIKGRTTLNITLNEAEQQGYSPCLDCIKNKKGCKLLRSLHPKQRILKSTETL